MKLTNENILIASLIGSKSVKSLPRFAAVQNEMAKHVIPPIPFLPVYNESGVIEPESYENDHELWLGDAPLNENKQFFPLSFRRKREEQAYLLPWEPMISVSRRNIITKRYVAKQGQRNIGSIKERWSADDYEITITGALYGNKLTGSYNESYPRADMEILRDYMLAAESLEVFCELFQILHIEEIVIEEINFPFSKGESVQAYEIKAVSNFPHKLTIQRDKNNITTPKKGLITVGNLKLIE